MICTPNNLNDIIYHSVTEKRLIDSIVTGAMQFPLSGKNGILLYGIFGTGKTTLANMLPDAIERGKGGDSAHFDFFACQQGQNGANLVSNLQQRASLVMAFNHSRFHYFVLDEVDNLTAAAMLSLKSVMNMPQTIFIMTTNHIGKIDAGVQNRCHRVNFNAAPAQEWLPFARQVLADCGARPVSDDKLLPVIDSCKGSAREIVSSMQSIAIAQRAKVSPTPAPIQNLSIISP